MRIRRLTATPYALPFVAPFATAHGVAHLRRGAILRLESDDDGLTGLGEIAPIAAFGETTLEPCLAALRDFAPRFLDAQASESSDLAARLFDTPEFAPLACAIDTAALDLLAQAGGTSIARLLSVPAAAAVPINALISGREPLSAARDAVARGFSTLKIKVGLSNNTDAEIARIAALREAVGPSVALRLDANGAWPFDAALEFLRRIEPYSIEYVEQPVASIDDLRHLRRLSPVPIAADELATGLASVRLLLDLEAADVIIVKPSACGGLTTGRQIIDLCNARNVRCVVTSGIESGVGVVAALHLAATLPQPIPACGLATLSLLAGDIIHAPLIAAGRLALPLRPGLGVTLDEPSLHSHRAGNDLVFDSRHDHR